MGELLLQLIIAGAGTVAFALLYSVPGRFLLPCGLVGGLGWLVHILLDETTWCGKTAAVFLASLVVVFLSRWMSVRLKCPATVFITTGIFPLVPGVGIYWTAYYMVTDQMDMAAESGFAALKTAMAIVLGITVMSEVPNRFFHRGSL